MWFEVAFVLRRVESSFLVRGNFCRCDYATRRIVDRQICLKKLVDIFLEIIYVNGFELQYFSFPSFLFVSVK
jgi:hypothetical protein